MKGEGNPSQKDTLLENIKPQISDMQTSHEHFTHPPRGEIPPPPERMEEEKGIRRYQEEIGNDRGHSILFKAIKISKSILVPYPLQAAKIRIGPKK